MCNIEDFSKLWLLPQYEAILKAELEQWHKYYLNGGIEGKTVIDLGAGCGETAQFYLLHGAAKVLAIESDPEAYNVLVQNFRRESRVVPLNFRLDLVKIDIEGSEEHAILETHFVPLFKHLTTIAGAVSLWQVERFKGSTRLAKLAYSSRVKYAHWLRLMWDSVTKWR